MEIKANFALERETTNSVRYKWNGGDSLSETVYVSKKALPTPIPMNIELVVRVPEAK